MSERIDHMAEARKHIEWAHEQQSEEGMYEFTVRDNALIAQAEATLALVEQQRIANLIALGAQREEIGKIDETLSDAALKAMLSDTETVSPEIREALGLRE